MYKSKEFLSRGILLDQAYRLFDENPPPAIVPLRDGARQLVPGDGPWDPELILVGEAPGAEESQTGIPFVGKSGKFLDELLIHGGIKRSECWITNVVKYRPPRNRTPDNEEIEASIDLLAKELSFVRGAKRYVALGAVATKALTMQSAVSPLVSRDHGKWIRLKGNNMLFVSYHPSAGLRSKATADEMRKDFETLGNTFRSWAI